MREWYPLFITFVFTTFAVLMKALSRRDGDKSPKRNDAYVAQSLVLGSLSALSVYLVKANLAGKADQVNDCFGLLLVYILILVALALLDRYVAWEPVGASYQRRLALGILVPNIAGVAAYFMVFLFAKSRNL